MNRPDEVYHVSVMPCYDKKLEASRDDFLFLVESQGENRDRGNLMIAEVDSVLTSVEVLNLLQVRLRFFGLLFSYEGLILRLPLLGN